MYRLHKHGRARLGLVRQRGAVHGFVHDDLRSFCLLGAERKAVRVAVDAKRVREGRTVRASVELFVKNARKLR